MSMLQFPRQDFKLDHYPAGDKLGPYEILAAIGGGGMGEVYKARDTRLDRIVAIKTSNENSRNASSAKPGRSPL